MKNLLVVFVIIGGLGWYAHHQGYLDSILGGNSGYQFEKQGVNTDFVSLQDVTQNNKLTVLVFLRPNCPWCARQIAAMVEYYNTYVDHPIQMIAVASSPDQGEVERYINDQQIGFPVVMDSDKKLWQRYRVEVVPTTFMFDTDMRLVKQLVGYSPPNMEEIRAYIEGSTT